MRIDIPKSVIIERLESMIDFFRKFGETPGSHSVDTYDGFCGYVEALRQVGFLTHVDGWKYRAEAWKALGREVPKIPHLHVVK